MFNNKLITIGVIAVIILAVVYLGNIVIKTTPDSDALGTYQYKVKSVAPSSDEFEQSLNDLAKDGWEYVGTAGDYSHIFKKK